MNADEIIEFLHVKRCLTCTTLFTMMRKQYKAALECENAFLKYAIAFEKAKLNRDAHKDDAALVSMVRMEAEAHGIE